MFPGLVLGDEFGWGLVVILWVVFVAVISCDLFAGFGWLCGFGVI